MKFVQFSLLEKKEKRLINSAINAAKHSVSEKGHKIGCAILCKNGNIFVGATNSRSRAIGSTCSERMAVDQLYFHGNKNPILCAIVGLHKRKGWTESTICTPCGVCLEMFWEMIMDLDMIDFNFICSSWNKKKILKIKLSDLYPQIDPVRRTEKYKNETKNK